MMTFGLINLKMRAQNIKVTQIRKEFVISVFLNIRGFSAAAASLATIFKKDCNLYLHEQNSKIGALNKIALKYTKKAYSS